MQQADPAANVDFANSVSCITSAPDQNLAAWFDGNGHGQVNALTAVSR